MDLRFKLHSFSGTSALDDTENGLKKNTDNLVIHPYWNENKRGFWTAWTIYSKQEKQEKEKKRTKRQDKTSLLTFAS